MGQSLFGGSTQSSSSEPVDITPPELRTLRSPFASTTRGLFTGSSPINLGAFPTYSSATGSPNVAPIGANEQTLLSQLMSAQGPAQDLIRQTLAGKFLPGNQGSNPFLEAAIQSAQRPTLQGLEETLSRTLPGRFTQGGHFVQPQGSSPFDRAAALATGNAASALGDIASNISFGGYEAERGRQQQAIQLSQQDIQTSIQNLNAQALPRLIQDLGIERGMSEYQSRIQAVLQALQTVSGTLLSAGTKSQSQGTSSNGIIPTLLEPFSFGFSF